MDYKPYIDLVYKEALLAIKHDDVPVGAIILKDGHVIASGHNQCIQSGRATFHAEMIAINKACEAIGNWRLDGCILISSLEPCCMCTGAILQSRIQKVIFTALDEKAGCILSQYTLLDDNLLNQKVDYEYIADSRSAKLLKDFFKNKRK